MDHIIQRESENITHKNKLTTPAAVVVIVKAAAAIIEAIEVLFVV